MNFTQKFFPRVTILRYYYRHYTKDSNSTQKKTLEKNDPSLIRNIGILAHIDAGKTTTTERMLFYSGTIQHMGEVHNGNTVTDFMEQERERGITITAASVTFHWDKHKINLLDTPGHIDFTMEVEQTLNVMDGAVIILDGSAGVEAQTVTVWQQADRYQIPRIIYVNKMDKKQAEFFSCVDSVKNQFNVTPIVLQLPIFNKSKAFGGIVDVLTLEKCEWKSSNMGIQYSRKNLSTEDQHLWEEALNARIKLTEILADLDDTIAEMIIADEKKIETVSSTKLRESVRKITLEQKGIPILCGSSYKNIGVQLLMDAVIHYLPSPMCGLSGEILRCFNNNFCARAFKVRHDDYKGPVTFFRIYSGSIKKGKRVHNVTKKRNEKFGKIFVAYADDYEEVSEEEAGNVIAVTDLKETASGDLVTSSSSVFSAAIKNLSSKNLNLAELFFKERYTPEPVFFCSIEASSPSEQTVLDRALGELEREDPSIRVTQNEETGQTVLGGMGELHLQIIKDRIKKEYKIEAYSGPLIIAYRETLINDAKDSHNMQFQIGKTINSVSLTMTVFKSNSNAKEKLVLDRSPGNPQDLSRIHPKYLSAIKKGVKSGLLNGPKLRCPVVNANVMLHQFEVGKGTTEAAVTSATIQCVKKLLKKGETRLLEPIMNVEIVCPQSLMMNVLNNLGIKRGEMTSTTARGSDMIIRALIPLSELLGYATELRILSSGRASFSMEFHSFKAMIVEEEEKAIKSVVGF